MKKNIMKLFIMAVIVVISNRMKAADISSSNVSNKEDMAYLRRAAEEQQTNAVAWLNYGKALNKNINQLCKIGHSLSSDAYDEAVRALEKGLLLDANNFKLHEELARVYKSRAMRSPSFGTQIHGDDLLKAIDQYSLDASRDLENALCHYSLALSNAPPFLRHLIEMDITTVKQKLTSEREIASSQEALKKQLIEEKKSPPEEQQKSNETWLKKSREWEKSYFASEKNQKRLEELRKQSQQEPQNAKMLIDYAEILIEVEYDGLGNTNVFNDAEMVLKKAVQLDKHNGHAYELIGRCFDQQGKKADALQYYQKALDEKQESQFIRLRIEAIKRMSQGDSKSVPERTGSTP